MGGEDIQMMESDSDSDDSRSDSDDSSSVFTDSGSDSGPHHPDHFMEWDDDWSMPSSLSSDSEYGSFE